MASVLVHATVDNRALSTLVSGDGSRYVNRQMDAGKRAAIARAPTGPPRFPTGHVPGNLKRSHFRNGVRMEGPYRAVGSVINNASDAAVVHEGYAGKIFPKRGAFKIPASSFQYYGAGLAARVNGDGYIRWKNPVNGQQGNPWLRDAMEDVLGRG